MARHRMSARRRISIASYKPPHEGVIHAAMTLTVPMWLRIWPMFVSGLARKSPSPHSWEQSWVARCALNQR